MGHPLGATGAMSSGIVIDERARISDALVRSDRRRDGHATSRAGLSCPDRHRQGGGPNKGVIRSHPVVDRWTRELRSGNVAAHEFGFNSHDEAVRRGAAECHSGRRIIYVLEAN